MSPVRDPVGSGDEPMPLSDITGESMCALYARTRVECPGFSRDCPAPMTWDAIDAKAQFEVGA